MTRVTTSTLQCWEPDTLARVARQARSRADELRSLAGVLERGALWCGTAARAQEAAVEGLTGDLRAAARDLDLLAAVWSAAAAAVAPALALLARAFALAAAHGLVVELDGRVVLPQPVEDALASAAEAAQALAQQAVAAVREADHEAAVATAAVRWLPDGFLGLLAGALLAYGVRMRGLPAPGLAPAEVAAWWGSLTTQEQQTLEQTDPERVGRLDGVPVAVRDRANRVVLARAVHDPAFDQLRVLGAVIAAASRPGAVLLDLDLSSSGRAAVAFGDLETADHVAVLVPGLNAHVAGALGGLVSSAQALRERALSKGAGTVATLAWIGYDAPGWVAVASDDRAQRGAPALRSVLRGIDARAAATGRDPHVTVSGHSYGSLVAGYALRERTGADDLVTLGSPGVSVDRADQLWVRAPHVFVAEAGTDPVGDLGRFGADPSSDAFGARQVQTDGRHDPFQERLSGIGWHTHYYDRGTESLDNLALVTVGDLGHVSYE